MREQRRLMMSPLHDSAGCSGILPWTYYVNDPSGLVLAVYHGRQMKRSQLGAGCPDPPTPPTEPTRRVFMYPVEYRAYGPDGINVVYERENCGVNAGQWVKRYLTTDYQGSVLQAHDASGNHEQHYELFGAEKGQVARRTGWLDREIDWETSPLSDLYRTVDLVNRKYDPQRATFLTSDPLWMMSADASSYHYGYHDPMNMIDPWGLSQITTMQPDDETGNGGGGTSGGTTNSESVTPFDNSFFWDRIYGERLRSIGLGGLPGAGVGRGSGLGPAGGGNGANGKTDALPSSSKTGTGESAGVPYKLGIASWQLKTPWMDPAYSQIGISEDEDRGKHSPEVMKYHKSYRGGPNNDDDETGRWCGSFVYWCFKQVGIQGVLPNPAYSQNWKDWGQDVMKRVGGKVDLTSIPYGAVVVFSSHVAFAVGRNSDGTRILVLGGNQSDQVKESWFRSSSIVAVRYPTGYIPSSFLPIVSIGSNQSPTTVR